MTGGPRIAVIGYGNPLRGDDAAGLAVVHRLRGRLPADVQLHEVCRDGASLIEVWAQCETAIVVDAVSSGAAPGAVHCWDVRCLPPDPTLRFASTHAIGLREAVQLAETLHRTPGKLLIVGIEGKDFQPAAPLSHEVERAIDEAAEWIIREVAGSASRIT